MFVIALFFGHTHDNYPRDKAMPGCVYMLMGIREFNSACSGVRIAYSKFSTAVTISVSRFAQRFGVFFVSSEMCFFSVRAVYMCPAPTHFAHMT